MVKKSIKHFSQWYDTSVFLTKNGHGRFAIVDIRAYERLNTEQELMSALAEGEASARKNGWVSMDSAMKKLGARAF